MAYTMTLTFPHRLLDKKDDQYRIDRVNGSTLFNPGDYMTKSEVDDLCRKTAWKIVIKRNKEKK